MAGMLQSLVTSHACRSRWRRTRIWIFSLLALWGSTAAGRVQAQVGEAPDAEVSRHLALARSAEARRDYLAAAEEYKAILAIRPGWALIQQSLGVTLHLAGRYPSAVEALRAATELDPELWGAHLFLGMGRYQLHRFEDAVTALRRSIAINPEVTDTHRWLGLSLAATGRHDRAIAHLLRVARTEGEDPEALFFLARSYDSAADGLFESIGRVDPESPFVYILQAERFASEGSPERAAAEYRRALDQRPDLAGTLEIELQGLARTDRSVLSADGPFADVRLEFDAGRHESAARLGRDILAARPESLEAMYWLGRCYKLLAVATLDDLVRVAPDSYRVDQIRAAAYMDSGESPKAVAAYRRALEKRPGLPGLRFALGQALEGMGSFEAARRSYEEELDQNPYHALARLHLGRLMLQAGQAAEALPHIRAAVEADPRRAESLLDLGRAYLEIGEHEAAIRELTSFARASPENDRVRYLLATAYRRLGRLEEARKEMQAYTELSRLRLQKVQADVRSVSRDLERERR